MKDAGRSGPRLSYRAVCPFHLIAPLTAVMAPIENFGPSVAVVRNVLISAAVAAIHCDRDH
jgi:hypothetical protein